MMDPRQDEFDDIRPYNDEEAVKAFHMVAEHPFVSVVSKKLFPGESDDFLSKKLKSLSGVDDFQIQVMARAVEWVLDNTASGFSYDGVEYLRFNRNKRFLAVSNHRDIIIDPAVFQVVLYRNGVPMTQIAVGDNLLSNKYVEALIRSNRMIKVIRGISARGIYLSSKQLSRYIRQSIVGGTGSVWIAQREGRAKDGIDTTEQGVLKMFDLSGEKDFVSNFDELHIIPVSISYEYEPCDILKAREMLISRTQKYVKEKNEDMVSILTGITQQKGHMHLNIGSPLTRKEIESAGECMGNDRYQYIRHALDRRIVSGYHLWKTNYMGYDLGHATDKYSSHYTAVELADFKVYIEGRLDTAEVELDRDALREILLGIYGNPVLSKEGLAESAKA